MVSSKKNDISGTYFNFTLSAIFFLIIFFDSLKDSITIDDKKGNFESALVFNGGRFGKDTDGSDINDDGISHKVGKELKLKGSYETLQNGAVKVYAELG